MSRELGLQPARYELGGGPRVIGSDNLSAITHELRQTGGRILNRPHRQRLEHHGLQSTRSNPRRAYENGVAEQAQRRILRTCGGAVYSVGGYQDLGLRIAARQNRAAATKPEIARPHFQAPARLHHLPASGEQMEHQQGLQSHLHGYHRA